MQQNCYHCGASCDNSIPVEDKFFCCAGCKMVFQLLDDNGMCNYYDLSEMPGISAKGIFTSDKYNYLVINLLGNSLAHCVKKYTNLSLKTTIKIRPLIN